MPYAVHTARRGAAARSEVLNTLPLEALLNKLRLRRLGN
jgi:hypothetical protein